MEKSPTLHFQIKVQQEMGFIYVLLQSFAVPFHPTKRGLLGHVCVWRVISFHHPASALQLVILCYVCWITPSSFTSQQEAKVHPSATSPIGYCVPKVLPHPHRFQVPK
jgi:hypothetical protein